MNSRLPDFGTASAGARTLCAAAAGLLLFVSACHTPVTTPKRDRGLAPWSSEDSVTDVPAWSGVPRSWDKLERVERWLSTQGLAASDFWRIEGELELGEGRLELAQRDGDPGVTMALVESARAAESGFLRVIADPKASSSQKVRADLGVSGARVLYERLRAEESSVGVLSRASWGAIPAIPDRMTRASDRWSRITIHHSAEAYAPQFDGSLATSADAIRKIQRAHVNAQGYGDIGYHFIIGPSGRVFAGRSAKWQGAHSYRDNNRGNFGICLLGNFEESTPTPEALSALESVIEDLSARFNIPRHRVYAHQDFRTTLCPGRYMMRWLETYRRG